MRPHTPLRRLFRAPLGLLLLSLAGSAADAQLNVPVRITFNNLEDRTTTGSIAHDCNRSAAVWMQEQNGPGWNLMWAVNEGTTWSQALPVQAAVHEDYEPRTMIDIDGTLHAVWQRQTGDAAEIMHGTRVGQSWTVEPITTNATEDITPDIATSTDGRLHVIWAGFDPKSGEGRLFYAKRTVSPPSLWVVEMLPVGDLGPFWTGAQPKIDISGFHDIIHVVYRGGDFGIYRAHYARRNPNGIWEQTQILATPNAEDLVADVASSDPLWPERVVVAMSGNDCFGCPSNVYVRRSDHYGLMFGAAQPASVNHSAELGAVAAASIDDVSVVAAELSGNIFTGNLLLSREDSGLIPDTLPPANHASFYPSIAQTTCTGRGISYLGLGIAFTNYGSEEAPPDSAEVWAIRGPEAVLDVGDPALVPPHPLAVTATPNPFSSSTVISAASLVPGGEVELTIYDSLGRAVRSFDSARGAGNSQSWRWDGRNATGELAPSGIFFVELKQGTARALDRLILIR